MKVKKIGDPILRNKARDISIEEISVLQDTIKDMFIIMDTHRGVGLAANQVGLDINLFIMRLHDQKLNQHIEYVCINPTITAKSITDSISNEGCLSIPGVQEKIKRWDWVELKWLDMNGSTQTSIFTGYDATVVQHEIDHLKGKLYIDHLSTIKKEFILKQYKNNTRR